MGTHKSVLALAGGVGGARLAQGLAQHVAPEALTVVVNTGDDFEHLGLPISPDLDTVMYTLAGLADAARGWGLAGESWACMGALERLGGPGWFRLGDQDLATHLWRGQMLREGGSLSDATQRLCDSLGVGPRVVPMSDQPVRTLVDTAEGLLAFQDYFVRRQCAPAMHAVHFDGLQQARMAPGFMTAIDADHLGLIVFCPSNPYVSIAPILALPEVSPRLRARRAPVLAVSPIVGGAAIKGPAAKMMRELGIEPSALAVARHYAGMVDGLVIDHADAHSAAAIAALGIRPFVTDSIMGDLPGRARLAGQVLAFGATLSVGGRP